MSNNQWFLNVLKETNNTVNVFWTLDVKQTLVVERLETNKQTTLSIFLDL